MSFFFQSLQIERLMAVFVFVNHKWDRHSLIKWNLFKKNKHYSLLKKLEYKIINHYMNTFWEAARAAQIRRMINKVFIDKNWNKLLYMSYMYHKNTQKKKGIPMIHVFAYDSYPERGKFSTGAIIFIVLLNLQSLIKTNDVIR